LPKGKEINFFTLWKELDLLELGQKTDRGKFLREKKELDL